MLLASLFCFRSLFCAIKKGRVAEQMGNLEHALSAYENALRHNAMSLPGLTQVAGIARIKENYGKVRALSPPCVPRASPHIRRLIASSALRHSPT